MKSRWILIFILGLSSFATAQNYQLKWGEDLRLKKGTTDLSIIAADRTGLYFTEERKPGGNTDPSGEPATHSLYKLDNNLGEVFSKMYKKELKGLDFQSFQMLGKQLFLFATDYDKRTRSFKIFGAKLNMDNGDLSGDFDELGSYELENKQDNYEMKITAVRNGTSFLMVSNISAPDRVSLGVCLLDKQLKKIKNTVINLAFEPNLYYIQDVWYSQNDKIILLGKLFEETPVGKKKRTRLVFKEYVMAVYNTDGVKEKGIPLNAADKYIINGKLIEQPSGDLLLAGFYSNTSKKDELSGFFINKVNTGQGELVLSSYKEINGAMLGKSYEEAGDEDDETKENKQQADKAKDAGDADELPNSFVIRSVDVNPLDNSIIITGEVAQYSRYSYYQQNYNYNTRTYTRTRKDIYSFRNQDVLLIHADMSGNIRWLNVLPKSQLEEIRTTTTDFATGYSYFYDRYFYDRGEYFALSGGVPFYSSFKSFIYNNTLVLIMNDHSSNNVNPAYGDKVRTVFNFNKKSNLVAVSVDLATGKMNRKIIASNNDETILMPRLGFVYENELIIPSWRQHLMAKTELKFAKITVR
ncbi:MAG TPA: hypothetical protein PKC72_02020 [Chitinophagaceae bacterium]|nr:hypothetical protein [Chitinophagaceae bacterium]